MSSGVVLWLALAAASAVVPLDGSGRRAAALTAGRRLAGGSAGGVTAGRASSTGADPASGQPTSWLRSLPGWGGAAVLAVVGSVGALAGPLLGVAAGAVVLLVQHLVRSSVASRAARRAEADLGRAVRVLLGELEAGAGPAAALASAAATAGGCADVFGAAAQVAARGGEASDVLLAGAGDLRLVGHAWRIGQGAGASLVEVLRRVAADLAAGADQHRAATVALAGPRSSALLLAGLPGVGIGLGVAMGADPLGFLFGPSAGRAVCTAGVLLDVAGIAWMARILRRAGAP